jgi:hypothetical protein
VDAGVIGHARTEVAELINSQEERGEAKHYQVRQVEPARFYSVPILPETASPGRYASPRDTKSRTSQLTS